jgi:hypothetical protein
MSEGNEEPRDEMAHVVVRRLGERYVAEIEGNSDLRVEADSALEALRRIREVLEDQVNNPSTARTGSE